MTLSIIVKSQSVCLVVDSNTIFIQDLNASDQLYDSERNHVSDLVGWMEAVSSKKCFSGIVLKLWTRGHIIVTDGWAGHTTPIHNLTHPTHTHTQRQSKGQPQKCAFSHGSTRSSRTDGPADGRTDKASYRVACLQLKKEIKRKKEKKERKKKKKKEEER